MKRHLVLYYFLCSCLFSFSQNALDFDGVDDYVTANLASNAIDPTFTVEYYVKINSWPASWGTFWNFDDGAWTPWFGYNSVGRVEYWEGGSLLAASSTNLSLNTWYHIAYVWDGAQGRIYIDGNVDGTHVAAFTHPDGKMQIGAAGPGGSFAMDATLDEMRISNGVLYTSNFVPNPCDAFSSNASTVALYHYDEGTGQTARDTTDNEYHVQLGSVATADQYDPLWIKSTLSATLDVTETSELANNDGTVCPGEAITISISGTDLSNYNWSDGGGSGTSAIYNPTSTTTYSVIFDQGSCADKDTLEYTVNVTTFDPNASSNSPVCLGDKITLSSDYIATATHSWTGPNSFSSALEDPEIDPSILANAGTYNLTVSYNNCSYNDNTSVIVNSPVDAGGDNSTTLCNLTGTTLNLNTLLDGGVSGGAWSEVTSSGQFSGNTFDASGLDGVYTFRYTISGDAPCPDDFSEHTVTVHPDPKAGRDSTATICAGTSIDLDDYLSPDAEAGSWTETTASGQFTAGTGVLNSTGLAQGDYEFIYVVAGTSPCINDTSEFTITVNVTPNAGSDNSATLCNLPGTTINLNTLLDGGVSGGTWSEVTSSGQFSGNTFDASGLDGVYTFRYTISGDAPCSDDFSEHTVTVHPDPKAGRDSTATICAGTSIDLDDYLSPDAETGSWTETTASGQFTAGTGIFNSTGLAQGDYEFIYVVNGTSPCINDTSEFTITVNVTPDAGSDNSATLCNLPGTTINLNTLLDGGVSGGTWSEVTSSGQFSGNTFDASGLDGVYTFRYTISGDAPCPDDFSEHTVTVHPDPKAGRDSTATICAGTFIDLDNYLSPDAETGSWTETTASGQFTAGTGVFNSTGLAQGDYEFIYVVTGTSPCINDTSEFTITVNVTPDAGSDNSATLCNLPGTSLNLNTLLDGGVSGGTWSEVTSSGQFSGNTFDASGLDGVYTFRYTISGDAPCPDDFSEHTVTVHPDPKAGRDSTATICAGTSIDLDDYLSPDAEAGSWTETTTSGQFTAGTGVFNSTGLADGNYEFIYVVTGTSPCINDTSEFTITINNSPDAGRDTTDTLCNISGNSIDLNTLLEAGVNGGSWKEITSSGQLSGSTFDANGLTESTYIFRYVIDGPLSCPDDSSTFSIHVNNRSNAGKDSSSVLCNIPENTIDLNSLLENGINGGSWSETTSSGQLSGSTFDANGLTSGIYSFKYLVPGKTGCPDDSSAFNITVHPDPVAGRDTNITMCALAGDTVNMNDLLASNAEVGTWQETTSSGQFNAGSGIFDLEGLAQGNYNFIYVVNGIAPCINDTAFFTVAINNQPNAGRDSSILLCNDESFINLNSLLSNGISGGNWKEITTSGQFNIDEFDPAQLDSGKYIFRYVIDGPLSCPDDSSEFEIYVHEFPNAGKDSSIVICEGDSINLNDLLDSNISDGIWQEITSSNQFDSISGAFLTTNLIQGNYEFLYLGKGIAPCGDDSAKFVITINTPPNTGRDITDTLCNSIGNIVNLNNLLEQGVADGTWSELTNSSQLNDSIFSSENLDSGDYVFQYFIQGPQSCPDDSTQFIIHVNNQPTSGLDSSITLCQNGLFPLDTLLRNADSLGFWQPESEILLDTLNPGTYLFQYITFGDQPCVNDTADFTIIILDTLKATAIKEFCNGDKFVVEFTAVGGNPNSYFIEPNTGTWNGTTWTSDSLLSGSNYEFVLKDSLSCNPDTIRGNVEAISTNISIIDSVSCFGFNDARIEVTVNGGKGSITYDWNTSDSTAIIENLTQGIYRVFVTDSIGCIVMDSIEITQPTQLENDSIIQHISCYGLENGNATIVTNGGTPPYTYRWNDQNGLNEEDSLAKGGYKVIITDANDCKDSVLFNIDEPTELIISTNLITNHIECLPNNGSGNVSVVGGTPTYTYEWSVNGENDSTITNLSNGVYSIEVTDAKGCSKVDSLTIELLESPKLIDSNMVLINPTCRPEGSITNIEIESDQLPLSYEWFLDGTYLQDDLDVEDADAGEYDLIVTDKNGCKDTIEAITLNEYTPPIAAFEATPDSGKAPLEVYFTNKSIGRDLRYEWIFGDGETSNVEEPIHTYKTWGEFKPQLIAFDENDCPSEDSSTVIIHVLPEIKFPNTFTPVLTPNGDGYNDCFEFYEEWVTEIELEIFNRWGIMVHKSTQVANCWDGRDMVGRFVPEGTYFYVAKFKTVENDSIQIREGHISLIR